MLLNQFLTFLYLQPVFHLMGLVPTHHIVVLTTFADILQPIRLGDVLGKAVVGLLVNTPHTYLAHTPPWLRRVEESNPWPFSPHTASNRVVVHSTVLALRSRQESNLFEFHLGYAFPEHPITGLALLQRKIQDSNLCGLTPAPV